MMDAPPRNGLKPWILAARPKTLPAAIVPVWVGSMPALFFSEGSQFSWVLFAATLASCLCIQVATNLFNDAIDHAKGADTERRLGPVRATASGLLSRKAVMLGALGFCALAALFGLVLIEARGWPILVIGLVSLLLAFAYTGGPFPLAYRGMGEIFVILFFGFVAVGGSWFVQTGEWPNLEMWQVSMQVGLYSTALLAINNLRDCDEDRLTGKRTLAVRLGKSFARREIALLCLAPPLFGIGFSWLPLLVLPLGVFITVKIFATEPGRAYNRFLALAALQLLLFAVLLTLDLAFQF
jgi:1,4-dihydroxy-2-naphthoate octaprenyltransferase